MVSRNADYGNFIWFSCTLISFLWKVLVKYKVGGGGEETLGIFFGSILLQVVTNIKTINVFVLFSVAKNPLLVHS